HQQEAEENGLNKENEFLQSVIQVIEANLSNEKFNVKILAEQLNMSQPTLFRKLKQVSKLNAIDMIHGIRMSKVASLLLEQQYTLQEISERVGYNDIRTLRKHFIEQFGVSPSKFLE
ncbi:helix-turn-helix domain-containing protein, partial [Bacteroides heparinolyticus]